MAFSNNEMLYVLVETNKAQLRATGVNLTTVMLSKKEKASRIGGARDQIQHSVRTDIFLHVNPRHRP